MIRCKSCLEIIIPECFEYIRFKTNLLPNSDYYINSINKLGTERINKITTDSNGEIVLFYNDFPPSYLSRHTGKIEFTLKKTQFSCENEQWKFCNEEKTYPCLLIKVEKIITEDGITEFIVPCNCE